MLLVEKKDLIFSSIGKIEKKIGNNLNTLCYPRQNNIGMPH